MFITSRPFPGNAFSSPSVKMGRKDFQDGRVTQQKEATSEPLLRGQVPGGTPWQGAPGSVCNPWGPLAWLADHTLSRKGQGQRVLYTQASQTHPEARDKDLNGRKASHNCIQAAGNKKKLLATNNYLSRLWTASELILS